MDCLINFWEGETEQIGIELDQLRRDGFQTVTSFVPWQMFESDISHSLVRFIQLAHERKLQIRLIVTPEVGIHFESSGLPKDVLEKAQPVLTEDQKTIPINIPPQSFPLFSMHDETFQKRFSGHLSRLYAFFSELERTHPEVLRFLEVVLTGSFWKYARSVASSVVAPFSGPFQDQSKIARRKFHRGLDDFYGHAEFQVPDAYAATRWKTQLFDEVNECWFATQSEELFRARNEQVLTRNTFSIRCMQEEWIVPEADPSLALVHHFEALASSQNAFSRMSRLVEDAFARQGFLSGVFFPNRVHFTALSSFVKLTAAEKQFLILKAMLLQNAPGRGGVSMELSLWRGLSSSFRSRIREMGQHLRVKKSCVTPKVIYLTPCLWAGRSVLLDRLQRKVTPGMGLRVLSNASALAQDESSSILIVDPRCVFRRELLERVLHFARTGRTVALPKSPFFTAAARQVLAPLLSEESLQIDLGLSSQMIAVGQGKLLLYSLPSWKGMQASWAPNVDRFLASALGLAEVAPVCQISDGRLELIFHEDQKGNGAVFVLNPTKKMVHAELFFSERVEILDLMSKEQASSSGKTFQLEAPPRGVLALELKGAAVRRFEAAKMQEEGNLRKKDSASDLAHAQLPGFDQSEGASPWS